MANSEAKFHSPAPGKYNRLIGLGETRFRAIESMLMDGQSPEVVTDKIQKEWGEFGDVDRSTVVKQLQRYRNEVIEPRIYETSRRAKSRKDFFIRARKMSQNLDVGQELTTLYLTQKGRIGKLLEQESKMPQLLLNQVREELKLANSLLANLQDFQLKTGLVKAAPTEIHGILSVEASPGKDTFFRMVESQDALRGATKEAMALLSDRPQLDDAEDGDFEEVEDEDGDD